MHFFKYIISESRFLDPISIADKIKQSLRDNGKSLGDIKYINGATIFHQIPFFKGGTEDELVNWMTIALLTAEKEAWNLIVKPDEQGETALSIARKNNLTNLVKLLESYKAQ